MPLLHRFTASSLCHGAEPRVLKLAAAVTRPHCQNSRSHSAGSTARSSAGRPDLRPSSWIWPPKPLAVSCRPTALASTSCRGLPCLVPIGVEEDKVPRGWAAPRYAQLL
ncbi:hypothetical protein ZWY2020_011102 [Hordeum vulgare]|nr:hypothetical protein ZWY2020_011102 [Hordeum vulgare]